MPVQMVQSLDDGQTRSHTMRHCSIAACMHDDRKLISHNKEDRNGECHSVIGCKVLWFIKNTCRNSY